MKQHPLETLLEGIGDTVARALAEDIGSGDVSAALVDAERQASAIVISREAAVIAGTPWVNEVIRQVDADIDIRWCCADGEQAIANQKLFELSGRARSLLTAERSCLNFLQLLSGTATVTRHYVDLLAGTSTQLLDTRKTLPGLRRAQKYAVRCGGAANHRIGLYDAFLIKENHIAAAGSIAAAIGAARRLAPQLPVEIEVERLDQLHQALGCEADIVMLDNFSLEQMRAGVRINAAAAKPAKLEASGGVNDDTLRAIAETGVDFISVGSLTKHVRSIDLSMRLTIGN